jgi:hypothetical protein
MEQHAREAGHLTHRNKDMSRKLNTKVYFKCKEVERGDLTKLNRLVCSFHVYGFA